MCSTETKTFQCRYYGMLWDITGLRYEYSKFLLFFSKTVRWRWFLITDSDFLGSHRMTCVYYIRQQVTTNPVALRTTVHLSLDVLNCLVPSFRLCVGCTMLEVKEQSGGSGLAVSRTSGRCYSWYRSADTTWPWWKSLLWYSMHRITHSQMFVLLSDRK